MQMTASAFSERTMFVGATESETSGVNACRTNGSAAESNAASLVIG